MALAQAAAYVEKYIGHMDNAITDQDVTNPARNRERYGRPTETMKALGWKGKNEVKVIECPKPVCFEDRDVVLKVTGSTVCGSDLHPFHNLPDTPRGVTVVPRVWSTSREPRTTAPTLAPRWSSGASC